MSKKLFIVPFNSKLDSGCDYSVETCKILAKQETVIGVLLGEPVSLRNFFQLRSLLFSPQANLTYLRPIFFLPGLRFRKIREVNYFIFGVILWIWVSIRYRKNSKILWFFEPFYIYLFCSIFKSYKKIYDCVDYFPGFSQYAAESEKKILKQVDFVFANSQVLYNHLSKIRKNVTLVPQGFSVDLFKKVSQPFKKRTQFKVVGFIGAISSRIDFNLIYAVAKQLPTLDFHFIGPVESDVFEENDTLNQSLAKMKTLPNVFFFSGLEKNKVPQQLTHFDIGIIPYDIKNSFNQYSFPMKFLEYFYMGIPIVSTAIEELNQYKKGVFLAKNSAEFCKYIEYIIQNGWMVEQQEYQRKVALSHSWREKVGKILDVIKAR